MNYQQGLAALEQAAAGGDAETRRDIALSKARLLENLRDERRFGSTETLRADRARIVDTLNPLALQLAGVSFTDLCLGVAPKISAPPTAPLPSSTTPAPAAPTPVGLALTFTANADGSAQIRWGADVVGVRQSRFVPPYDPADLALVLRALDELQASQRGFAAAEIARLETLGLANNGLLTDQAHRAVGVALFTALTADPQGHEALATVRNMATANGSPLAMRLHLPPQAVDLAALPWELLWDSQPAPLLISHGRESSLTRHLDLSAALPPLRSGGRPLRILPVLPQAGITDTDRQENPGAHALGGGQGLPLHHFGQEARQPRPERGQVDRAHPGQLALAADVGQRLGGEGRRLLEFRRIALALAVVGADQELQPECDRLQARQAHGVAEGQQDHLQRLLVGSPRRQAEILKRRGEGLVHRTLLQQPAAVGRALALVGAVGQGRQGLAQLGLLQAGDGQALQQALRRAGLAALLGPAGQQQLHHILIEIGAILGKSDGDLAEREVGGLAALALPVHHPAQAQLVAAAGQAVEVVGHQFALLLRGVCDPGGLEEDLDHAGVAHPVLRYAVIIEEMLIKIPQLTTREQLLLLEAVSRALRSDIETHATRGSAERLLGIMKAGSDLSDDDVEGMRFERLTEKHS